MSTPSANATPPAWTPERVIQEIRARHADGRPLRGVWRTDRALDIAARRCFGGWRKALLAAGLSAVPYRRWAKESVVEAIRARQQLGQILSNVRLEDSGLGYAAQKCFGSWQAALAAAGVSLPDRWTADRVLAEIHRRRKEGLPLAGFSTQDPALFRAARRHFGDWQAALAAAGIPLESRRSWSPESVVAAIQARQGLKLKGLWRSDPPLYHAAKRHCGGWFRALRAAGLPVPDVSGGRRLSHFGGQN
jgi:hypothetical protein